LNLIFTKHIYNIYILHKILTVTIWVSKLFIFVGKATVL